jgi:Fe-S cluster assembly ATPase SufC
MKKFEKVIFIVVCSLFLFTLTNCEEENDNEFDIIGTWYYKSHYEEIYSNSIGLVGINTNLPYKSITFNKDSSCVKKNNTNEIIQTYKWSLDSVSIILKNTDPSLDNDALKIVERSGNRLVTNKIGLLTINENSFITVVTSVFEK